MSAEKEVICIVCPVGCKMTVKENKEAELGYDVEGNECKKGISYGIEEVTNPTRNITSTVCIRGAHIRRLPVKTNGPIPKGRIFACMDIINDVKLEAPVKMGDVVIKDVLGVGVDIVATRSAWRVN